MDRSRERASPSTKVATRRREEGSMAETVHLQTSRHRRRSQPSLQSVPPIYRVATTPQDGPAWTTPLPPTAKAATKSSHCPHPRRPPDFSRKTPPSTRPPGAPAPQSPSAPRDPTSAGEDRRRTSRAVRSPPAPRSGLECGHKHAAAALPAAAARAPSCRSTSPTGATAASPPGPVCA